MKRRDLIATIATAAKKAELRWELLRDTGDHEIWSLDGQRMSVPRHRKINEFTARAILKSLEDKLGKEWWR